MPAAPINRADPPPLLTVRDVERRLGIGNSTARKLLASGAIPSIKLPGVRARRVRPEDLDAYIARTGGAGILAKWLAWRTDIEEAAPVGRGGNRKAALREARRNVGLGVPLVAERLRDTCGMEDALIRIAASKRGGKVNLGPLVRPDLRRAAAKSSA